jgi:glycosyltransferase involved in cell wall biosynthesis
MAVSAVESLFRTHLPEYVLELIVTDNGSVDSTWAVVTSLAAARPYMKALRFSRNFGYQNSLFAGLSLASGHAVIALDADLEDPPDVIPEFVKHWEAGFDVVYGVRRKRHAPIYLRLLFRAFYKILRAMSALDIPENSGDFRLLDRKVAKALTRLPERNLYLRGLVTFLGFRQKAVYYDRNARIAGKSKFRLIHYATFAIDGITAVSKTPLRAIGVLGVTFFIFSALLGSYYAIGSIVKGVPVQGFTTIVVLMLFMHGLTFIFIGVIGEYLSRIFDDSKGRPRVIVTQAVNVEDFPESL